MIKIASAILLASATPATPAPAPTPAQTARPDAATIINKFCRLSPEDAEKAIETLPKNQQTAVVMICAAYEQGQSDGPDTLPAGGTQI